MLRKARLSRADRKYVDGLAGEILTRAGLPATRRNRRSYVDVSGPLDEPGTTLTMGGFVWLLTDQSARGQVDELVRCRLGPAWRSVLTDDQAGRTGIAQYVRTAGLPDVVRFDPAAPGSQRRIPVGLDEAGEWVHLDLEQTPHVQVAGAGGYGRTSFLRLVGAWLAGHNASVTICDPKRREFDALEGLPDITIHRDTADIASAVRTFRASVEDYARATQRYGSTAALDEDLYPTRALLVDGIDAVFAMLRGQLSLASSSDRGYATDLQAVVDDLGYVAFCGRAFRHHLVLAGLNATALSPAIRDQFGACIGIGRVTASMRTHMFGPGTKPAWGAAMHRGRALVGTHGDAHMVQLAHITDVQATSLAMVGPHRHEVDQ